MTYLAISISIVLIVIILILYYYFLKSVNNDKYISLDNQNSENFKKKKKQPCILCGSILVIGENIKSQHFPCSDGSSIVHTFGCPYCSGEKSHNKKTCPICKQSMKDKDYLIGKMWVKQNKKRHLHISGCTQCVGKKL